MSNVSVLMLDSGQIHFLLSNHELFADSEIKLAAKRKVKLDNDREIKCRMQQYELNAQMEMNRNRIKYLLSSKAA